MTEARLEEILQTEEDEAKVLEAVNEYRAERRRDHENKQHICDLLCFALRATRDQRDLQSLVYHNDPQHGEMVTLAYSEGGTSVDVTADSGIAMIRDILRAIS